MQYGSKQSHDLNAISPNEMIYKEKSLSYEGNQSRASVFPLIDSTLGDKKDLEEEDDDFEDCEDEDGDKEGGKHTNDGRSNLDDDFYFNEHQNNNNNDFIMD